MGLFNYYQSQTWTTKSNNHNTFGLCEGLHISTNDIGEKFLTISKNYIGEFFRTFSLPFEDDTRLLFASMTPSLLRETTNI